MCPRCSRTEVPDTLVNTELNLEFFKRNFTPDFIRANVEKITFCGNDGDPIYAHDLIEVIKYFKSVKPVKFVIVTNGSYKYPAWWQELGATLTDLDHLHFSLDGWDQASNEQYRINSDWDSIMSGVKTLRASSKVYMVWDAIAFKFNQDKLNDMRDMAKNLGFDQFQLTRSTKFHKVYKVYPEIDNLQPRDNLISDNHRYQRELTLLSDRKENTDSLAINLKLFDESKTYNDNILPLCSIGNKGLFINSQGQFFPCCWLANRYSFNNQWSLDKLSAFYSDCDFNEQKISHFEEAWKLIIAAQKLNPSLDYKKVEEYLILIDFLRDHYGRKYAKEIWEAIKQWHNETLDLHINTLEELLKSNFWSTEFENFAWPECKAKCNISVVNQQYATEW